MIWYRIGGGLSMMLKLYKGVPNGLEYWEAWADGTTVTFHWGTLGDTGYTKDVELVHGETADSVINKESQRQRANGFSESESNAELVIHYKCDGWGGTKDLEKRHHVEDIMNECLGWTGNGHCDGGDIGSGSINIYCFVVDPVIAAETTIATLRKEQLLDDAFIATKTDYGNEDEPYRVHWPLNYSGEFYPV